mmetsp:Transcript_22416/g.32685  ORF Transcript_22416/g.32685 Transcript_22416/m.32685 type:complete len:113 (-) Transcript_22416:217-555(-)
MSVWSIGDRRKENWETKYSNGNGYRKTISSLSPERPYIPSEYRVNSPTSVVSNGERPNLPPSCFDGIGASNYHDHWPYRFSGESKGFSRPNSSQVRGPPSAHPKDKRPSTSL